jgi:hypothetical protein
VAGGTPHHRSAALISLLSRQRRAQGRRRDKKAVRVPGYTANNKFYVLARTQATPNRRRSRVIGAQGLDHSWPGPDVARHHYVVRLDYRPVPPVRFAISTPLSMIVAVCGCARRCGPDRGRVCPRPKRHLTHRPAEGSFFVLPCAQSRAERESCRGVGLAGSIRVADHADDILEQLEVEACGTFGTAAVQCGVQAAQVARCYRVVELENGSWHCRLGLRVYDAHVELRDAIDHCSTIARRISRPRCSCTAWVLPRSSWLHSHRRPTAGHPTRHSVTLRGVSVPVGRAVTGPRALGDANGRLTSSPSLTTTVIDRRSVTPLAESPLDCG